MATIDQIKAEIAAGPQTQEALDAALLKYSPEAMAAAFPEFGNVADYNNAAREAYARTQAQQQAANREAVRADMAANGEEFRVANPGGNVEIKSTPYPTMSAIPQSELDAARARLTPEQQQFIDWQMQQINPMTAQRIGDEYARQGVNPYLNPQQAQDQIDRASRREELFAQAGVQPGDLRPWTSGAPAPTPTPSGPAAPSPFVIGGGIPSATVVGGGTVPPASQVASLTPDLSSLKSQFLRASSNLGVGGSMTPQKFTQTQMGSEFGAMQTPQATYESDLIKSLRTADAPTVSNAGFTQYSMSAPQGGSNYLPTGSSNSNAAFNPQPLLPDVASADDVANWNAYSTYRTNALSAKTPIVGFDEWLASGKTTGVPEPVVTTPEPVYNYGANDGGGA
jgi:hypothetical protein